MEKFEETIQYRNDLLKNQTILDVWLKSSIQSTEVFNEADELSAKEFVIKTEDEVDFNVEFMSLACPFPSSTSIEKSYSEPQPDLPVACPDLPIACPECNKQFLKKVYLRKHFNNVHKQGLDEICQHCGKVFKNSKRLKAHLLTHQTEKKYKCDQCAKQFVSSGDLSRHIRVSCPHIKFDFF